MLIKRQYRGDPGLFGFLGKAIGGIAGLVSKVVPGPLGAVAGGVSALLKPKNPSLKALVLPASVAPTLSYGTPQGQYPDSVVTQPGTTFSLPGVGPFLQTGGGSTTYYGGGGGTAVAPSGAGCMKGHHLNKAGYYTKQGYVAPESRCVKNRRRNPLNARALSRSLARISSAKNAASFLSKVTIRREGCGCK